MLSNSLTFVEPLAAIKVKCERLGEVWDAKFQDGAAPNRSERCVLITKVLLGRSTPEIIKRPKRVYPIGAFRLHLNGFW